MFLKRELVNIFEMVRLQEQEKLKLKININKKNLSNLFYYFLQESLIVEPCPCGNSDYEFSIYPLSTSRHKSSASIINGIKESGLVNKVNYFGNFKQII